MRPVDAVRLSKNNRLQVENAPVVGCYFCESAYAGNTIEDWADEGQTAICPYCWVDAVVPGPISKEDLRLANHRWFGGRAV